MKNLKICALLPTSVRHSGRIAGKRTNIKNYFGLNVIIDKIEREIGISVDIVQYDNIDNYNIILFSCLSIEDYYSLVFTIERKLKGKTKGIWIAGGPSISNINPFIKYFKYIVLGRGEDLIIPLLSAISRGMKFKHDSVVHSPDYKSSQVYKLNYAKELYPEKIGKIKEEMYGCKYNCSYCRYRTATLPPTKRNFATKTTMPGNEETFWDLEIKDGKFHTTSLDGLTEQIRYAIQKPIKNKTIVSEFIRWSGVTKKINLKLYQIIGFPYNPDLDFSEITKVFSEISEVVKDSDIFISMHFTPFGADPHTAMQWEEVNIFSNYRHLIEKLRVENNYLFETSNIRVMYMRNTMHPYSLLRRMVFQRASLQDMDILQYLGSNPEQNNRHIYFDEKFELTLSKFDVSKFVKEYPIGAPLPTQNILTWKTLDQMKKEGIRTRSKLSAIQSNNFINQM